jgi:hypothetical protein
VASESLCAFAKTVCVASEGTTRVVAVSAKEEPHSGSGVDKHSQSWSIPEDHFAENQIVESSIDSESNPALLIKGAMLCVCMTC